MEIALNKTVPLFPAAARPKINADALSRLKCASVIALLLSILHAALALTATIDNSATFDEPIHLTAGYSYWLRNDFRLDPENGNLPARWAALPLLINRPNFPAASDPSWQHALVGPVSNKFFYHSGNNPDRILLPARAMMSILSAALCLLIFFCAQKLFGPIGGLLSETLAVFDPNLLAHGALVTSDTAAALFFTAAVWTTWKLFHRLSIQTFLPAALSVGGLVLSKMSAPLFVIMVGIMAPVAIWSLPGVEIRFAGYCRNVSTLSRKAVAIGVALTFICAISVFSIWASFSFRFSALTDEGTAREVLNARWSYFLGEPTPAGPAIGFARDHHLLPEAYLYGLLFTERTSSARPAFLDGHWSDTGFRSFFLRAFSYKTPLPVFCLLVIALAAAFVRWKRQHCFTTPGSAKTIGRDLVKLTPIWVLIVVYGGAVLQAKLNIGIRHLLPLYPAFFIACGASVSLIRTRRTTLLAACISLLLFWQIAESFWIRPHYLAYFNQVGGGPANGYKHLVDSSLDWGQDLPGLKDWLDRPTNRTPGDEVYLAYFGTAEPTWYQIRAIQLPDKGQSVAPLRPGLYCVSATVLQQVYEPEGGEWTPAYETAYRDALKLLRAGRIDIARRGEVVQIFQRLRFARLCAYLRQQQPLTTIGHSILIFRLSVTDLSKALDG